MMIMSLAAHLFRRLARPATVIAAVLVTTLTLSNPWLLTANAYQTGYSVDRYDNSLTYGTGVYFAPYHTTIYSQPDLTSDPVFSFDWSTQGMPQSLYSKVTGSFQNINSLFVAFYPQLSVAAMAVVSDTEDGWAEVVYDQRQGKTGWVKLRDTTETEAASSESSPPSKSQEPVHLGRFQTWLDFMKYNGRAAGIYWLTGVSDYNKGLRMQPDDKAKFLPVQIMKSIRVKHVRGNWMLVEVTDINKEHPLGWVRWRDNDGRLMIFPNIAGRSTPYVMGVF